MNLAERIYYTFQESAQAKLNAADILAEPIALASERLVQCFMNEGKLLACGNGASAADAQHLVSELINRFERERPGLAALALNADSATLTSIADDSDFSMVFARQISALGQPGDILLAISTNGCSRNIIEAARAAQEREMAIVALTGQDGGELAELLTDKDILICAPGDNTARIQEIHQLALHCLCDSIDHLLLGA
ncbi:MAG: phosphoheptose isomerase [Hydrogenophilaceae bacterium]|nr:phosphoheptose isomerase [Hydrogenophilaceae bacterium]